MKKTTMATAFATVLAAGVAGVALAPSGAAAQEGSAIFLVPERGAAGPTGQEYILMLVPRQPAAGRSEPEAQQQGRTGPGMMTGPMMGQMMGQGPGMHGPMMGQGPGMQGPMMGQGPGMQGSMAEGPDLERLAREMFARGYQLGRSEGQGPRGGQPGMVDLPPRYQEPGVTTFDRPGRFDIFLAPPPGGPDMRQVRQALGEARQALRQGEAQQAEQALARIDRMLGEETAGGADRQRIRQAIEDAEQALERNDRQAAQDALRQARQAIGGPEQARMTPTRGGQEQQGAEGTQEQQGAEGTQEQQPTAARPQPQQQGQQ